VTNQKVCSSEVSYLRLCKTYLIISDDSKSYDRRFNTNREMFASSVACPRV